uniref:Uncharacterized protein n=1 Tax=Siphoviridae sp. ctgN495 TaxID=2825608 RepID=A0A8S5UCM5_9CAUD|nr:MAG TPA: hypothetical protein [Siphoviridae sp. ctgN495]
MHLVIKFQIKYRVKVGPHGVPILYSLSTNSHYY